MAFMTSKGSFEPMVMFFELTNSLAIFQMMMNEILWDLINTREVASFIDDIIVGMKKKKEHNKMAKETVKRLVENNLYAKLEKCKWKVRKVGFLGLVIGPEGIKIKEKKVKRLLEWPTPKKVKDIQNFLGLASYYQQFIKYFVTIARLLHNLLKKD